MSASRKITAHEYAAAFESWASVAMLRGKDLGQLADAIKGVRGVWAPHLPREINALCQMMDARLKRSGGAGLRFMFMKSCLLDRLIYCGEPLRTRKCPIHEGVWSGVNFGANRCPHHCEGRCGCTTGWMPEPKAVAT